MTHCILLPLRQTNKKNSAITVPPDTTLFPKELFSTEEACSEAELKTFIKAAKAFARSTYVCVYVIDFARVTFPFMSENIVNYLGVSSEEVQTKGFAAYRTFIPAQDINMARATHRRVVNFMTRLPAEARMDYTAHCDFHVKHGVLHLVHHTATPLSIAEDGRIRLALCTIAPSSAKKVGDLHITSKDSTATRRNIDAIALSEAEHDVLFLSAQGYSMQEIALLMNKSIDTIKSYKRALFSKLEATNITQAVMRAATLQLL